MEASERPHPHHLAESVPPASYATRQETTPDDKELPLNEVGQDDLEGATRASSADPEKAVHGALPEPIEFPDGGWRAWRCVVIPCSASRPDDCPALADFVVSFPRSNVGGAWCISFTSWGRYKRGTTRSIGSVVEVSSACLESSC